MSCLQLHLNSLKAVFQTQSQFLKINARLFVLLHLLWEFIFSALNYMFTIGQLRFSNEFGFGYTRPFFERKHSADTGSDTRRNMTYKHRNPNSVQSPTYVRK